MARKATARAAQTKTIPNKLYFPIREAAQIAGVEPYVLRFWEKEFPMLSPVKEKSGHRRYRRKDIELVLEIKRLLYDQGFTISGARSQLQKVASRARASSGESRSEPKAQTSEAAGVVLDRIRRGLNEILTILGKP